MQNRICDLCGHEIQDLMLAALDHSIPVIRYARCLDLAIEDAIRECNHPENLRAAHSSCNAAKNGRTREEWYAAGLNDRDKPRFLTDGQLLDLQFRLGAGGRVGGRTAGRRNVESGHWAHIHTLEHQSRAGLARGKQLVESGEWERFRTLPQAKAAQRQSGRERGQQTVTGGHLARIRTPEHQKAANRVANHTRWHVQRNIKKEGCALCAA